MITSNGIDVERWGRLETWEAIDAACILGGMEPEQGANATVSNKALAVLEAIKSAILVGALVPYHISPNGEHHLLAGEVVRWAESKGLGVPAGLASAVDATTLAFLARHKAAKASALAEQDKLIRIWQTKDLWAEDELAALLCGLAPGQRPPSDQARRAVQLAIAAGSLDTVLVQQPGSWEQMYTDGKTDCYLKPSDAIAWASTTSAEFPAFPAFDLVSTGGGSKAAVDAAHNEPMRAAPPQGVSDQCAPYIGARWEPEAKRLALLYVAAWQRAGYEPTVGDAALFVEGQFSSDGKTGKNGKLLDQETIRKALVGITGRKPGERSSAPKIPKELRETLPD